MSRLKDLTGQKFGRLAVIERAGKAKDGHYLWRCKCECGKKCVVCGTDLTTGHTQSCGCLHKEGNHTTHGMRHDKTYVVWCNIKQRCFNPNHQQFKDYGGRGITIYAPWIHDFKAFYDYVSKLEHCGEKGYTLDRKDNDGNYEPGNLRFATKTEQARNRHSNVFIEYNGEEMTLAEAAEKSGINYGVLARRYHVGDRGERLFLPVREIKRRRLDAGD